jgi:D-alanine-D-alanine ligase-like ATP-grasp enzyme
MYPAAYIDTQDAAKIVIANLKEQSSEKIQNLVGVKKLDTAGNCTNLRAFLG